MIDTAEVVENNILDRLFTFIEKLPQQQEVAKRNITRNQEKQKQRHDRKIDPTRKYKIGDKVLMYDAARDKHFTGKLKPKWKEPFYIHNTLPNNAYKLQTMDGKVLAAPINILLLKSYFDRETWEPVITLEN